MKEAFKDPIILAWLGLNVLIIVVSLTLGIIYA